MTTNTIGKCYPQTWSTGISVSCYAEAAFLEASSNGIDARIAVLDWALPEMSGFELLGA